MKNNDFKRISWILCLLLLIPTIHFAQEKEDVWTRLKFLEGTWQGTGDGEPGISKIERQYESVLGDKFLHVKNRSFYEPQVKNPGGEVHEDIGFFSHDKTRKLFVLRQFHVEGFVNQYVLDTLHSNGTMLVFVSEVIENIPAGWRARETYELLNANEFTEKFELARPGNEFKTYSQAHFHRRRK